MTEAELLALVALLNAETMMRTGANDRAKQSGNLPEYAEGYASSEYADKIHSELRRRNILV